MVQMVGQIFSNLLQKLKDNEDNGVKNVIIFDADYSGIQESGGYKNRREYIEGELKKAEIQNYFLFLFPNNNDDGDFELLLENIINQEHNLVLKCFKNYEDCLKKSANYTYQIPSQKAKMYAYVNAIIESNKNKESLKKGNWFFDKSEYWNLQAEYLQPFLDFWNLILK